MKRALWIDAAIVLLALLLRVVALDVKPAHFDEGVNGWFVDEMTRTGFYHYDPGNFHGPLHFYALFASLTLFGRNLWALRLPIALVSTLCVVLTLAFRRHLPERACRIAALAMAISPGFDFYGRYAIHESWLVLFLMLAVWGLAGLWRGGSRREIWATGMALTGMVLTKETYAIHFLALLLAVPGLLALESFSKSSPLARQAGQWTNLNLDRVIVVATLLIFFFYTGGLLDWSSLPGLWVTFAKWGHTGTAGASGHEKSWHYFIELIARYEWPALIGAVAALGLAVKGSNRFARYLAMYAFAALAGYSLIAYKTPWCVITLAWPFLLLFGLAIDRLARRFDPWIAGSFASLVCAYSLGASCLLNFRDFTNEDEPYVYVQTLPDIDKLLVPLRRAAALDARNYHLIGHVLTNDHHPLPWLLGDFTHIELLTPDAEPKEWDGAFLLVDSDAAERIEGHLTQIYFKEPLRIRGNAADSEVLYLNAEQFAFCFPGREPEFVPGAGEPLPP